MNQAPDVNALRKKFQSPPLSLAPVTSTQSPPPSPPPSPIAQPNNNNSFNNPIIPPAPIPIIPPSPAPVIKPPIILNEISHMFNGSTCNTLKQVIKLFKLKQMQIDFINKISAMLALIPASHGNYNNEIVSFVLDAIEHYFIAPKCGQQKLAIAIEILKPFFHYDDKTTIQFIELILPSIPKTNMLRRAYRTLTVFFSSKS